MTKLTTERLDKLQDNLLQFQDAYSDPADKENYDIFVDALHMLDEFKAAKEKLIAYEQAAEHPAARITWDGSEFSVSNVSEDFLYGGTAVYLAPVLPKQPELVENLKMVMNSWLAMEPKLAFQPEFTDVMMLLDAEAAPAKPVIPEQNYLSEKLIGLANHIASAANGIPSGWQDWADEIVTDLRSLASIAQPVIPEQTERERIRREHAEWSDATFGNVGPVGPLKHLSKEALEAAAAPDDLLEWADMQFLLWDAQRRMGLSDEFITRAMIEKLEINKKRQWPEPKDGEPRLHINTQSAQPVSEPYRLPDGWVMVPQQIFLDASDIESICSQCGDGHKSGYGDFTDGLLWVGDIQCDNGTIMHGLHISSSDYQEEGGLTLAEFKAPVQESE